MVSIAACVKRDHRIELGEESWMVRIFVVGSESNEYLWQRNCVLCDASHRLVVTITWTPLLTHVCSLYLDTDARTESRRCAALS